MTENQMAVTMRESIERRIEMHMRGAYQSMIEVGRCLVEAKDSGVVPHGEWTDWVARNTGFGERQAQKLMQVARNVEPGSAMARLPVTQIQMLLALPKEAREPLAEKAVEESMTVKQLRADINAMKAEAERVEKKHADELGTRDRQLKQLVKQQGTYTSAIEEARDAQAIAERRSAELQREVNALKKQSTEVSPAVKLRIEELERMLAESEAEAERQAELRQEAQAELINAQMGGGDNGIGQTTAAEIAGEIRMMIGSLGVLVQMGAGLDRESREELLRVIKALTESCHDAEAALAERVVVEAW